MSEQGETLCDKLVRIEREENAKSCKRVRDWLSTDGLSDPPQPHDWRIAYLTERTGRERMRADAPKAVSDAIELRARALAKQHPAGAYFADALIAAYERECNLRSALAAAARCYSTIADQARAKGMLVLDGEADPHVWRSLAEGPG